jgi:hypothetical protein
MIQVDFIDAAGLMGYDIDHVCDRSHANVLMATSCNGDDYTAVNPNQMEMNKDGQVV